MVPPTWPPTVQITSSSLVASSASPSATIGRSSRARHVRGERGRRDDVAAGQVALGQQQEQQVAEVVTLVGADGQDSGLAHPSDTKLKR